MLARWTTTTTERLHFCTRRGWVYYNKYVYAYVLYTYMYLSMYHTSRVMECDRHDGHTTNWTTQNHCFTSLYILYTLYTHTHATMSCCSRCLRATRDFLSQIHSARVVYNITLLYSHRNEKITHIQHISHHSLRGFPPNPTPHVCVLLV